MSEDKPDVCLDCGTIDNSRLPVFRKCLSKSCPPWTRKEMVLFGGTAWFFLLLAWYCLQNVFSIYFDYKTFIQIPNYKLIVWLSFSCLLLGGAGMYIGLFKRPSLRGWKWMAIMGIALFGEILYSELLRAQHTRGIIPLTTYLDELSFCLWIGFGFFRSVFDTLSSRGRR